MCDPISSIFQAIEFIESHLHEEITVAQIADAAGYSLFHFVRKFNQIVHHTPYDYLMRRRLTEAADALIHSKRRIIDIAQDYCFNDQETFSRVFRKMFQMTPSQCRKENGISLQHLAPSKTIEELRFINSSHFMFPRIVEENELHLVGLMTLFEDNDFSKDHQRERLAKDLLDECVFKPQTKIYELIFYLKSKSQAYYYFLGIEKSNIRRHSPVLVSQIVNEGRFVTIEVSEKDRKLAFDYIHSTWIPRNRLTMRNGVIITCWSYETNELERIKTILIPVE